MAKDSLRLSGIFLVLFAACNYQLNQIPAKGTISEFKLHDQNEKPGLGMDKNGNILYDTAKFGKMSVSGDITSIDQKLIASYHNDTLYTFGTQKIKVRIDSQGSIYENGAVAFHWDKIGRFKRGSDTTGIMISPNDPKSYTNASIVLYLYLMIN